MERDTERDKSCTVSNSRSKPKFTELNYCKNMIEMHCNYENISIAGENYNPFATTSDGMKSMWDDQLLHGPSPVLDVGLLFHS